MFKKIKRFFKIYWFYINHKRCDTCHKWSPHFLNMEGSFWINNPMGFQCEDCFNKKIKESNIEN
jgi:hypothetical protein